MLNLQYLYVWEGWADGNRCQGYMEFGRERVAHCLKFLRFMYFLFFFLSLHLALFIGIYFPLGFGGKRYFFFEPAVLAFFPFGARPRERRKKKTFGYVWL